MDNRNLSLEQRAALDEAITLIDGVIERVDVFLTGPLVKHRHEVVDQLHNARNKVNAVATGERAELGQRL